MLEITAEQLAAITEANRADLRRLILHRWQNNLREAGDEVGAAGREKVLAEVEALAPDRDWEVADLLIVADILIVALAEGAWPR